MNHLGCALLLLGFSLAAHAGGIYKCTGGREIAYQNFPCAEGQREDLIAPIVPPKLAQNDNIKQTYTDSLQPTMVSTQSQYRRPYMLFQRTTLSLGMTDDEVLNLPNWGRPAKITRSKGNRVWREEWFYDGKRLSFENAMLTGIEDDSVTGLRMATLKIQE